MLLKILAPAIVALVLIVVPLMLIYRRAKQGKSVKKPLYMNLGLFFFMFFTCATVFLTQGVAAANEAAEAAAGALLASGELSKSVGYLSAALAVGLSGIGSAKAVSSSASAAIGALVEDPSTFGKAMVFVGMAEGIAIYGLLVAIIIVLL